MDERLGRMDRLIDGLLTYASVDSTLEVAAVDLNRVLDSALDNLEQTIDEARGEVVAAPLPTVAANEIDCLRLLQNLVHNAVKFRGDAAPRVEISVTCDDQRARLSVRDNGIGIEQQHLRQIFMPLQRLHGERQFAGAGPGLATCRKICQRYGGDISVESTPGAGSVFRFSLPLPAGD